MLPRVIVHNEMSLDGRLDWITPGVGQFYALASQWKEDATLAGSDTLLRAAAEQPSPEEDSNSSAQTESEKDDSRPLLVVPDSRGRVRSWHRLRKAPYWRGMVALCSRKTPSAYLDYLEKIRIDSIITGNDHVDLREALEALTIRYGVKVVRVDSGGTLNGVLLREGLINEVSVLLDPCLVGGTSPSSIFRAADLTSPEGVVPLELIQVQKVRGDILWLRYEVRGPASQG